jgi:hypothetical protein
MGKVVNCVSDGRSEFDLAYLNHVRTVCVLLFCK